MTAFSRHTSVFIFLLSNLVVFHVSEEERNLVARVVCII